MLCLLACAAPALHLSSPRFTRAAVLSAAAASVSTLGGKSAFAEPDRATFSNIATQTPLPSDGKATSQFVTSPSGLRYKDVKLGSGEVARKGDTVAIQYTGRLLNLNGKKFASTYETAKEAANAGIAEPFVFTLGSGSVIPGLEELVTGMSKGGYRRGVLPPPLGYDSAGSLGPKPNDCPFGQDCRSLDAVVKNPNRDASLVFDVQLERVRRPGA